MAVTHADDQFKTVGKPVGSISPCFRPSFLASDCHLVVNSHSHTMMFED